jgi:hypothetical protein
MPDDAQVMPGTFTLIFCSADTPAAEIKIATTVTNSTVCKDLVSFMCYLR